MNLDQAAQRQGAVVLRGVDDWRIVYEPKVEQVGNIEVIAPYSADTMAASLVTPRYRA